MKLFFSLCFLTLATFSFAQHDHKYCGTPDEKSEWLIEYQKNPEAYSHIRSSNDTLYIALTVHNVGSDLSNLFPEPSIFSALCKLNNDFKPYKILFYLKRPVRNILNSTWNDHNSQQGFAMMQQNNFFDSANCYIVSNPAGACGYFSPSGGAVALSKSCLGPNNSTWTHEMGHFFSLPHTFVGWEGQEYDPSAPTPNIVGGRSVEFVNRNNCNFAADGFCDTPPDYLSFRWTCNSSGQSSIVQTDPNGETFSSDGTLFMSYSNDACTNRFSNEQVNAVRANMLSQNIRMTSTTRPYDPFQTPLEVNFVTPQGIEVKMGEDFFIQWEPVDQALGYQVQISRNATFSWPDLFTTTVSPQINVRDLGVRTYFVRVRPFVPHNFCTEFSNLLTFNKVLHTSLVTTDFDQNINIFPNPMAQERYININEVPENMNFQVITNTGKIITTGNLIKGDNRVEMNSSLPPGFVVLRLFNNEKNAIYKILIQ